MEEEDRKKLKDFDDVLQLLNDMIKNIDILIDSIDAKHSMEEKYSNEKDAGSNASH